MGKLCIFVPITTVLALHGKFIIPNNVSHVNFKLTSAVSEKKKKLFHC